MGVVEAVEDTVLTARDVYLTEQSPSSLHHLSADEAALWPKLDHLLYLPVLGLERPRDLYYYQGQGLSVLYGFTYKYLTVEHFLGQLTHLRVGASLAEALACTYAQAWYPGYTPLTLFVDWHVKPHWTKAFSHAGPVSMWGRVMPGTKQLLLSSDQGRLLGGWNHTIDTHLSHLLVDLEAAWEQTLRRSIACTIVDSEGGGLPLGKRYAAAQRPYLSVLPQEHALHLADFVLDGSWESVRGDPEREAVLAHWADPTKVVDDPRRLVLMRPLGQNEPTRIYTGWFGADVLAREVPWLYRRRWANSELRIRDLIQGANLNANYGYCATTIPNRTRQRQWATAQAQVTITEQQVSDHQAAIHTLRRRLADLQNGYAADCQDLAHRLAQQQVGLRRRQEAGQATRRAQQQVEAVRREMNCRLEQFRRRQQHLLLQLYQHRTQAERLGERLAQRLAARDAIDTETLCRERDLEKDQIMLNEQILLANLHDWAAQHYFAPAWQRLSLEKAMTMIYRKAGWVRWEEDRIEVVLAPYRYRDQQQAMEVTCAQFNAAQVRWRDGRRLHITVAPSGKF